MADDKIRAPDPEKGEASAVQSVTEATPHKADKTSEPGPYEDLSPERPPVSTTRADVPIAHSLVAGAGAPTPPEDAAQAAPAEEPKTTKKA